jgi:hypothetical protein
MILNCYQKEGEELRPFPRKNQCPFVSQLHNRFHTEYKNLTPRFVTEMYLNQGDPWTREMTILQWILKK